MLFVIRPNPRKAEAMDFVAPLGEMIEACGAKYVVYTAADCIPDDMLDKADCVVVLGGDGTILRAARDIFPRQIPLLGINFGHLGYLAQVGPEEALQAIKDVVAGEYQIEKRAVLEGNISGERDILAVNEVCINRGNRRHMTKTRIEINGSHIDTFTGDGMLICTATGSTAYNQNAGGPILMPCAENAVITPICAMTFIGSSLVTCPQDEIFIRIEKDSVRETGSPVLLTDGRETVELKTGDTVTLRISPNKINMIKLKDHSFYRIIRQRLLASDE